MTIFKDAQRIRSKPVARSKRVLKVPTEDQEQITLMSWAHRVKFGNGRLSDYLIHIPNGGSRNIIEAAKFKKMGVKAGVDAALKITSDNLQYVSQNHRDIFKPLLMTMIRSFKELEQALKDGGK